MAGTVVIIVLLALFPVIFLMTNVVGAALIGFFFKKDRDDAYAGTEYLVLANGPAAPAEE
jgi:fluoride ion exporter CrcB/FEX